MTPSILKTRPGVCYICRRKTETALHHIYEGPFRWVSDEQGFTVFLCPDCHQYGPKAVHRCRDTALWLKARCQRVYERNHSREEFMRLVGRNYLD